MPGLSAETWLDREQGPQPIHIGLIEFQSRDRLKVPKPVRDCIGWLSEGTTVEAVFELDRIGQVIAWPWSKLGPSLLSRRRQLVEEHQEGEAELLAMDERFLRVSIEAGGRFPGYDRMYQHLGILAGERCALYVAGFPGRFELWSESFRLDKRQELAKHLSWVSAE